MRRALIGFASFVALGLVCAVRYQRAVRREAASRGQHFDQERQSAGWLLHAQERSGRGRAFRDRDRSDHAYRRGARRADRGEVAVQWRPRLHRTDPAGGRRLEVDGNLQQRGNRERSGCRDRAEVQYGHRLHFPSRGHCAERRPRVGRQRQQPDHRAGIPQSHAGLRCAGRLPAADAGGGQLGAEGRAERRRVREPPRPRPPDGRRSGRGQRRSTSAISSTSPTDVAAERAVRVCGEMVEPAPGPYNCHSTHLHERPRRAPVTPVARLHPAPHRDRRRPGDAHRTKRRCRRH